MCCDGKQRKTDEKWQRERSSSGREEMGCRSASLAMHCDIAGPISTKQRKNEKKQSNGYSVSMDAIGSDDCKCQKEVATAGDRWCQCAGVLARLETGEAAGMRDFAGDLFRRNKGCQVYRNCSSARWEKLSDGCSFTEKG
ncbi:hypothetical protein B296_00020484 [Ensete ventricosum]|uniref:Uncharacterized protein n=1 Tax=Ensete ventricosum TaxID=4639 RepID=A0A426X0K3_ENSVE|nr:hypothetical protein B296_00020484 [Ensete ventricosum]